MQCPSLQNEESALTFEAKLKFYGIHSLYNQLKGNFNKALNHREKVISLFEKAPHQITEMPQRYRSELANLLTVRHFTGNYEGFQELLNKIEDVKEGSKEENVFTFREIYPLKQLFLLNTGRAEEAYQLIPEITKGLELYSELINPARLHSFWYNNAIACFIIGNYKEALPWTNLILTPGKDKKVRTDLRDFVSILEIILHYETGKYSLVEAKLHSARERLTYKNKLYEFEKVVLQNISQLIKVQGKDKEEKMLKACAVFLEELQALANKSGKEKLPGLEEIILWVKKK